MTVFAGCLCHAKCAWPAFTEDGSYVALNIKAEAVMQVHMLTEALNLATQRLAAAGRDQQQFLERETKATKMLHAAAAEAEVLR